MLEKILDASSQVYYSDFVMLLFCLTAFMAAIFKRRHFEKLKYFFIYPLSSIIQTLLIYITYNSRINNYTNEITFYSTILFSLIEALSLYYIFYCLIQKTKVLVFSLCIYAIFFIYFLYTHIESLDPNNFFLVQNLFIIAGSGYSLYQVYKKMIFEKIEKNPYFLICFGALAMATCSLPIYFATDYVFHNGSIEAMSVNTINFISYSIINLFISISFLCTRNPNLSKV